MARVKTLKFASQDPRMKAGKRLFDYLKKVRSKKLEPMKEDSTFRASSLERFCAREEVLASKYDIMRIDAFGTDPSLSITLDIGDVFHDLYRTVLYGPMGEWRGAWKCMCGWSTDDDGLSRPPSNGDLGLLAKMPSVCPVCDAEPFDDNGKPTWMITFKEWGLFDKELLLTGHADGWSVVDNFASIADLKSQSSNQYRRSRAIKKGHDVQLTAYMHMTGYHVGEIWYMNKSPWGDHSDFVKDIGLPYDAEFFDAFVRRPMLEMREGLCGGRVPVRTCPAIMCSRAKLCQLKEICFAA